MLAFLKYKAEHPRIARIRQLHLFATLRPRELRVIDGLLHEREYLEGEIIFDEGEAGQALYAVLEGRVLICKQDPDIVPLAEIPAGALFGQAIHAEQAAFAVEDDDHRLQRVERFSHEQRRIARRLERELGFDLSGTCS